MRTYLHAHPRHSHTTTFLTSLGLRRYSAYFLYRSAWYAVAVHRGSALPAASFGSSLTADTLALRLALPLVGRAGNFNPQVSAPCRTHETKPSGHHKVPGPLHGAPPGRGNVELFNAQVVIPSSEGNRQMGLAVSQRHEVSNALTFLLTSHPA